MGSLGWVLGMPSVRKAHHSWNLGGTEIWDLWFHTYREASVRPGGSELGMVREVGDKQSL
jgi:hypothetical protein